jgi:hypothetical protein
MPMLYDYRQVEQRKAELYARPQQPRQQGVPLFFAVIGLLALLLYAVL